MTSLYDKLKAKAETLLPDDTVCVRVGKMWVKIFKDGHWWFVAMGSTALDKAYSSREDAIESLNYGA